MTRPNYSTEPKKNLSGFWYIVVRYVSGTPLAGDPGDDFWFDENHPFPPPRWHRAWLAVWYPSTKHILVFGRFPEPLRVGWTKGTHDFWGNFWGNWWYRPNGGLENVSPVKYGYVWFLRWILGCTSLTSTYIYGQPKKPGSLEEHQSSLLYTQAGSLCMPRE